MRRVSAQLDDSNAALHAALQGLHASELETSVWKSREEALEQRVNIAENQMRMICSPLSAEGKGGGSGDKTMIARSEQQVGSESCVFLNKAENI